MKTILFVHRYLAVGVGVLMVLWCLSGFVMMYQSYPALGNAERLNGLAPLELGQCCELDALQREDAAPLGGFRIEMLLDEPVLRLGGGGGRDPALNVLRLRSGTPQPALSEAQVLEVARRFGAGNGIAGTPRSLGVIDIDQWTIQTARRNAPTYKIAFDDSRATEIYVSGSTGEVFQHTNRKVRILGWLGAVPHWLYPTILRQDGALWTQIVIWTSIAGAFLAATGMYVGITRVRRNRQGELSSPFRGWWYWHHISGLVFGVLALTWVFSGLLTMNPWGALSGDRGNPAYRSTIVGTATWGELEQFLAAGVAGDYRLIRPAPFNGSLYLMATRADGTEVRLNAHGEPAPLTDAEIQRVIAQLPNQRASELLEREDSYYYGHKREAPLPVWRVLMDDEGGTRLYIDRTTGSMRAVGTTGRLARWIRSGLHDMDFPVLRIRPIWDVVVISLLLGVTSLCMIGTWLAIKRVRMDFKLMKVRRRRRLSEIAAARSASGG